MFWFGDAPSCAPGNFEGGMPHLAAGAVVTKDLPPDAAVVGFLRGRFDDRQRQTAN